MGFSEFAKVIKERVSSALLEKGISEFQIFLFGSQAKGTASQDSDFDILILTNRIMDGREIFNLQAKVLWSLRGLKEAFDVIIKSNTDFAEEKDIAGSLAFAIKNEAVAL
jgi:predicted nucleotidyltransferase